MLLLLKISQKRNTRQGVQKVDIFFKNSVDNWFFIWYYYKAVAKNGVFTAEYSRLNAVGSMHLEKENNDERGTRDFRVNILWC